jgi:hypothetical protein
MAVAARPAHDAEAGSRSAKALVERHEPTAKNEISIVAAPRVLRGGGRLSVTLRTHATRET